MKAAVLFKLGQPLEIIDIPKLPALNRGQVLVKMVYSGLCHSQLMEVRGLRGYDKYLPHMLGHEGVGIVSDVGKDVTKVRPGDWVILTWIKGTGIDAPGGLYDYNGHTINSGGVTTFSEATIVAENRIVKLPEGLPPKIAVLFGCALPTGAGLVINEISPSQGKTYAIFGLGGVGLSALLATQLYSPQMVIALDVEPAKLELAKELGATHVININKQDPLQTIFQLTHNMGVDYSLEAGGTTATIEQAFAAVRDQGGLCVFASHPEEGKKIRLEPHMFHRGKQIQGSWGGSTIPDTDIPKLAALYQQNKLPLEKLISHSCKLEEINHALYELEQKKVVRILVSIAPELEDSAFAGKAL